MKILLKLIFGCFTLLLCYSMGNITGPSTIRSIIIPISINENGQILCKTEFTENRIGGYSPMKIHYGFCVITKDTIIEYNGKTINPSKLGEDDYYKESKIWNKIFISQTNDDQLMTINSKVLNNKYSFSEVNVKKYKVDKIISLHDFENQKNIYLKDHKQRALGNAKSTIYYETKVLNVKYDFGNILLLENTNNYDDDGKVGANFDYFNPWTNKNYEIENIGFDVSTITGIIRTN